MEFCDEIRDGKCDGMSCACRPRLADLVDGGENRCEGDAETRSSDEDDDEGERDEGDEFKGNRHFYRIRFFF